MLSQHGSCLQQQQQAVSPARAATRARQQGGRAIPRPRHHTPPSCSIAGATVVYPTYSSSLRAQRRTSACSPAAMLGLGQLATADSLQQVWQQDTLPACLEAWDSLLQRTSQLQLSIQQGSSAAELQAVEQVLLQLDALLGTCQQVLLVCGLLKDRHIDQQWRAAATAVFVEARSLEQEVCSDVQLHRALWACLQHLEQAAAAKQQHQKADSTSTSTLPDLFAVFSSPAAASHPTGSNSNRSVLIALARSLLRHMQLESLTPASLTAPQHQLQHSSDASVLSQQEQQALLSGLMAEQKVLVNRMQALLLDPSAAPVVEVDAESREVLLSPLQATAYAGGAATTAAGAPGPAHATGTAAAAGAAEAGTAGLAAAAGLMRTAPAAPAQAAAVPAAATMGIAHEAGDAAGMAVPAPTAPAVAADGPGGDTEVCLDLQLVTQLLQQHPNAEVRADVYCAGLLQRLDGLLLLWGELAEVRRKIGRMHGYNSYADFVLQHSFLGSAGAAAAFCHQLAAELQPAACEAVSQLQQQEHTVQQQHQQHQQHQQQQQQQQQRGQQQQRRRHQHEALSGSDMPYLLNQEQQSVLSRQDLQQLEPYLSLAGVLSGLDKILQLLLGLQLRLRQPHPGDVWSEGVLVLELLQPAEVQGGQPQGTNRGLHPSSGGGSSSRDTAGREGCDMGGTVLGTIYLDLNGGYAAQLLLYGQGYPMLSCQQHPWPVQQLHPGHAAAAAAAGGSTSGASVGVAAAAAAGRGSTGAAVALGLQSGGVLHGSHQKVALGLWELCHEFGHAVNFILSSAQHSSSNTTSTTSHSTNAGVHLSSSNQPSSAQHSQDGTQPQGVNAQADACAPACYHLHASWQPVELIEVPSTLFEAFVMDSSCLQLLGVHEDTREALPQGLADRLAAFMRGAHYCPAGYQSVVLSMLVDIQWGSISSRQLGQQAPHQLWGRTMEALSAMPGVEVTLQQVSALPRLLATSGQGYGYAVARCLAEQLQLVMLQHLRQATAHASKGMHLCAAESGLGTAVVASTAAGGGHGCDGKPAGSSKDGCDKLQMERHQQQWRHVLSMGVGTSAGKITALLANLSRWRRQ